MKCNYLSDITGNQVMTKKDKMRIIWHNTKKYINTKRGIKEWHIAHAEAIAKKALLHRGYL